MVVGGSCIGEVRSADEATQTVDRAAGSLCSRLRRGEPLRHAVDYLRGPLASVERMNGWQLAKPASYAHARGIQRILDRYIWDAEEGNECDPE